MKSIYIMALLLITIATAGCATSSYSVGEDFDSASVSSIERGKTTAADLVSKFGEPFSKTVVSEDEEKWIYTHASGTAKAQNYLVTVRVESEGIQKTLDLLLKDGVVVNYTYNEGPISGVTTSQ